MTRRTTTLVGAAVGLALFLVFGLLNALLYGGYAGVMLAAALCKAPLTGTLLERAFVVTAMVVSVTGGAALFAAAGAAAGAAVGLLVGPEPKEVDAPAPHEH